MSSIDYLWKLVELLKLPLHCQIVLIVLIVFLLLLYALNKKIFDKWVVSHRKRLTRVLTIMLAVLILCITAFLVLHYFYFPEPPEDKLVVAISPFYLTDEYGKTHPDINTATMFKERLEAEKELRITVIMLDTPLCNDEDAKKQGKKVGAHLVVYGETKKVIGNIVEIKYHILPLSSLEITPQDMLLFDVRTEGEHSVIRKEEKATFHSSTENPITIIESLTVNASSSIYAIGAFESYKKFNFTSAMSFFKAIENYDNQSTILFYIAACYYFSSDLNESVSYFDKVIAINPQLAKAWNNKGVALRGLGRYEEAIAAYDNAIALNPQLATAWSNKGVALRGLGRYEEAIAAYDNATAINPQYATAWNNKGVALDGFGRYEEAIAAYDNAITINPQYATAWYNKGGALRGLGRYEEAEEAFDKAHEIDPTIEIP